jgi:predicted lipid-binding transport protein (Tim44 family)
MPRGGGRSSSPRMSSRTTSRSTAAKTAPPQNNQLQQQSRGSGLMGSLMTGMAFGAGSEMMRGLFRNSTVGGSIMPLLLSGGTAFAANRFLLQSSKYKGLLTFAVFGGSFLLLNSMMNRSEEPEYDY